MSINCLIKLSSDPIASLTNVAQYLSTSCLPICQNSAVCSTDDRGCALPYYVVHIRLGGTWTGHGVILARERFIRLEVSNHYCVAEAHINRVFFNFDDNIG
jgi:hypothetical protein